MLDMPGQALRANGALCAAASMQTLSKDGPAEQSAVSKELKRFTLLIGCPAMRCFQKLAVCGCLLHHAQQPDCLQLSPSSKPP